MPANDACFYFCAGICTAVTEGIGAFACIAGCAVACDSPVLSKNNKLRFRLPLQERVAPA
jgi:hypothetical protein